MSGRADEWEVDEGDAGPTDADKALVATAASIREAKRVLEAADKSAASLAAIERAMERGQDLLRRMEDAAQKAADAADRAAESSGAHRAIAATIGRLADSVRQSNTEVAKAMAEVSKALTAKKQVIRGADNRVMGVETVG